MRYCIAIVPVTNKFKHRSGKILKDQSDIEVIGAQLRYRIYLV